MSPIPAGIRAGKAREEHPKRWRGLRVPIGIALPDPLQGLIPARAGAAAVKRGLPFMSADLSPSVEISFQVGGCSK